MLPSIGPNVYFAITHSLRSSGSSGGGYFHEKCICWHWVFLKKMFENANSEVNSSIFRACLGFITSVNQIKKPELPLLTGQKVGKVGKPFPMFI